MNDSIRFSNIRLLYLSRSKMNENFLIISSKLVQQDTVNK